MFHIVFNANEGYIKYLAVLCTSIVKNTRIDSVNSTAISGADIEGGGVTPLDSQDNKDEGYHFHILTDYLSPAIREKLQQLENILSQTYPCQFSIYTMSDSLFQGLPSQNGKYLAYFRLKTASILPQEIQKCLYLDVDMLCVDDIREIFGIDLQGKVCGAVLDAYRCQRVMQSRDGKQSEYNIGMATYINSGMLLLDLQEFRKQRIEKQCFELLNQYIPTCYDQDILSVALESKIHFLPLEWNLMHGTLELEGITFKGEVDNYESIYTREEYERAKKNAKILHYLNSAAKPWIAHLFKNNGAIANRHYRKEWWDMALQTPVFHTDLVAHYIQINEDSMLRLSQVLQEQHKSITMLRRPHKLLKHAISRIFRLR